MARRFCSCHLFLPAGLSQKSVRKRCLSALPTLPAAGRHRKALHALFHTEPPGLCLGVFGSLRLPAPACRRQGRQAGTAGLGALSSRWGKAGVYPLPSLGAEVEGCSQAAPEQQLACACLRLPAAGRVGRVGRLVEPGQPVGLAQPEEFDFPLGGFEVRGGGR